VAVTIIALGRCGEAMFSAVQATGVSSSRSITQSSNQAIKQSAISNQQSAISNQARKCFYHRGTRENDQVHGVGKDFGASRKKVGQTSREAQPLAYSVDSIVLPCSSVIKTLA
jgi:hypothetical protein